MVGVAAHVASAQAPWQSAEESPGWDFTAHVGALEAMLAEMQRKVRRLQSAAPVRPLGPSCQLLLVCRSPLRSGPCRPPSRPGSRLAANTRTPTAPWRI